MSHDLCRSLHVALGCTMVALGVVGIALPGVPTTPFLLGAAWAFARSSPRHARWLREHPRFGPPILAWEQERAIPRSVKWSATAVMMPSGVLAWSTLGSVWACATVSALLVGGAAFVWSRPDAKAVRHAVLGPADQ